MRGFFFMRFYLNHIVHNACAKATAKAQRTHSQPISTHCFLQSTLGNHLKICDLCVYKAFIFFGSRFAPELLRNCTFHADGSPKIVYTNPEYTAVDYRRTQMPEHESVVVVRI